MHVGKYCLVLSLLSLTPFSFASEYSLINKGVSVSHTDNHTLSIQNQSDESITIDVLTDNFTLVPNSGLAYECSGFTDIEINVQGIDHDYFEVPCNSQVIFSETFKIDNGN